MFNGHWTFVMHKSLKSETKKCKFPQKIYFVKMFIWATLTCCCIGTFCVITIVWGPAEWTIPFVGEDIWIGRDVVVFCNSRLCRFQFNSIQCQGTPAVSLMGRVIHRLWVSYLLRMSDDDHIDNNVEEKVGDWDPVLKSESVNITMVTLFPKSWFNIEGVTM